MRLALYIRVSTETQVKEGASRSDQLMQMKSWAQQKGHDVIDVFDEPGITATDDRRPVFQRMIEDATSEAHPFDALVVHSQSRFMREFGLFYLYEKKLKKAKVEVISITQPVANDSAGALVRTIISVFDDYQSKETSKHVKRCMKANARAGFFNGSRPPFGYQTLATDQKARGGYKKKLVINTEEASVVRQIFSLAIDGRDGEQYGLKKISAFLNTIGVAFRGRQWHLQKIHVILTNPIYMGEYIFNRRNAHDDDEYPPEEWIRTPVPPIIDKAEFEKAAAILSARAPGNTEFKAINSPSLLTGLIECRKCKKGLTVITGKGGRYRYYRCLTRQKRGNNLCDCPNIPKEKLEEAVLQAITKIVLEPRRVLAMIAELRRETTSSGRPDLMKEKDCYRKIGIIEEKLSSLYEQISLKRLELEGTLAEHIRNLERQMNYLKIEIEALKRKRAFKLRQFGESQVRGFIKALKENLLSADKPAAKFYLRILVGKISIRPDTAEISGSVLSLANAISKWKPGTPITQVPGFFTEWCGWQESNPRPLGS